MAAYRGASIGLWKPERDPAEGEYPGCDVQRVLMSTDNRVKRVLWTTVSQTVHVLAANGTVATAWSQGRAKQQPVPIPPKVIPPSRPSPDHPEARPNLKERAGPLGGALSK